MKHKKLILMAINVKEKTRINGAKLSTIKRQKVNNDAKPKEKVGAVLCFGWSQEERAKYLLNHMQLKTSMAGIIQSSYLQ